MRNLFLLSTFYFLSFFGLHAQGTILNPGDVVLVQIQMDFPDDFRMVPLVDLQPGTTIYIADIGTYANGSFATPTSSSEGVLKYVAPALIPAGHVIRRDSFPNQYVDFTDNCSAFPYSTLSLHTAGDQLLVFQDADGDNVNPICNPNFIFAINAASTTWNGTPTDHNQTSLPMGLTDGVNAIAVGSGSGNEDEWDNAVFNGNYPYTSLADFKADFYNTNNWVGSNFTTAPDYFLAIQGTAPNVFGPTGLPVDLVHFSAKAHHEDQVVLDWLTASELNNDGFDIERSLDGRNWESIGYVNGKGTTIHSNRYNFVDKNPEKGNNYYRLKQMDFDGAYEYSNTETVSINTSELALHIFPNPVKGDVLNISINEELIDHTTLRLFSMDGQLLKEEALANQLVQLDLGMLSSGMYLLEINNGNMIKQERVIKQ